MKKIITTSDESGASRDFAWLDSNSDSSPPDPDSEPDSIVFISLKLVVARKFATFQWLKSDRWVETSAVRRTSE